MKLHPIVPFRDPLDLDQINLDRAEEAIHRALAACPGIPLVIRPVHIIDDKTLFKGRKVMREKQEVKIEEIGTEL